MEQVPKNEQNKLSRGLRRYFKQSKHLLRKPMEALSSEEQERLLRDAELPELQKSDPFLQRCTEKTAPGLSTPTRSWIIVFFASTPTIDIEPEITEISPLRTFFGDFLISVHSLSNVRNIKTAPVRSEMTPKSLERETPEKFGVFRILRENCVKFSLLL